MNIFCNLPYFIASHRTNSSKLASDVSSVYWLEVKMKEGVYHLCSRQSDQNSEKFTPMPTNICNSLNHTSFLVRITNEHLINKKQTGNITRNIASASCLWLQRI